MQLATHISRLGTETAFAVSEDARAWAANGHQVFPFHLGDMNLPTPPNIVEAAMKALRDGRTGYAPAAGLPDLRAAVADDASRDRGVPYVMENVSIQPGGKPVIGKFLLALMNPGDEVLYPNPGYPIYESQIQFQGGIAVPYGYDATPSGFTLHRDQIVRSITPRTRFLIYNNAQNPLGAESDADEMAWIAELAQRHDLWVLSDEAYFHIRYSGRSRSIASLPGMLDRTVILAGHSKRYAMTGWRLGAAIGPREVIDVISKLNVNQESCTCHFVQVAGVEALRGDQSGAQAILTTLRQRRDVLAEALRAIDGVSVHVPEVTFYLYPDVTEVFRRGGFADTQTFRLEALHETGVSFCARDHFGRVQPGEDRVYIRLAYSGIDADRIREGLARLGQQWMAAAGVRS
jgi:aspartate/methionine/tyrosine aminotransferase